MTSRMERKRIGGTSFCIADCKLWAEIYYLDSPTNYRECLPRNSTGSKSGRDDGVNLNSIKIFPAANAGVLLMCIILLVTIGWLCYGG